ncbi:flavodoxin [Lacrimispora sp.]|uniref:flavodoxin n=1 Tax=Lacrimispora sp. TaxID=2719234 RepID=UPI0032E3F4AF
MALAFSLAACGNSQNDTTSASVSQEPITSQSAQAAQLPEKDASSSGEDESGSGSKILIAYFTAAENSGIDAVTSASYTTVNGTSVGRVRAVADMIAAETGGELFSIQTSVVYPTDGGELIDYAAGEQDANARPELTRQIENLDQYDAIFIGYPNWWYDMPMVMYSFFEKYDFAGKTIIPFNVHNGSRFSSTIKTIQELEPEATVVEDGFTVSERTVADAAGDVASWLDELGY